MKKLITILILLVSLFMLSCNIKAVRDIEPLLKVYELYDNYNYNFFATVTVDEVLIDNYKTKNVKSSDLVDGQTVSDGYSFGLITAEYMILKCTIVKDWFSKLSPDDTIYIPILLNNLLWKDGKKTYYYANKEEITDYLLSLDSLLVYGLMEKDKVTMFKTSNNELCEFTNIAHSIIFNFQNIIPVIDGKINLKSLVENDNSIKFGFYTLKSIYNEYIGYEDCFKEGKELEQAMNDFIDYKERNQ